jgi:thiosulfate dehydrogenase [quinone] large subunit
LTPIKAGQARAAIMGDVVISGAAEMSTTFASYSSSTVTVQAPTSVRTLIALLRLSMAWVFLYAASHQVFGGFSIAGFLGSTKTFHWLFTPMAAEPIAGLLTVLVAYGHLLIGLSLLTGLLTRVSSIFGIALMLLYWMAHMDFPYISATTNFLVNEHIVYALVLGLMIATHAGHIFGLDAWAARLDQARRYKWFDWAVA